ncbi:molybdopterin-dependent oxidoreductase [Nocardia australiensis]|uniref:molybdopterin-dependent oxidoreductase n=1 Tax=Nocardia australiensis TaxID=2887191 RepID=UPI001D14FD76|nr:molybdopterin-dependent oxidoreductase [Nocardia australiensis]
MADLRGLRVLAGIVSVGLALGVAEVIAAFAGSDSAPLAAIGNTVVDHTPDGVREWVISTFGTNDKSVLYVGMAVVAIVVAGLVGVIERTTRPAGSVLLALFGVIAAVIAANRTGVAGALPTVIGVAAGIFALRVLTHRIDAAVGSTESADARDMSARAAPTQSEATADRADDSRDGVVAAATPQRRLVLRGLAITGGLAVIAGAGGRLIGAQRHNVSGERAAVRLPEPVAPPTPLAPDVDLRLPGLTPYLTSNSDFYRIDTALVVPQVSIDDWSLRIHGMVDREITISWADLANRTAVESLVTLACVSNPVGGDLIGNARWRGYRLDALLAEAGPHPDADMVLSHSIDGFTAGSPLAILTDGRDAMLAVGMNGEPLPVAHGYPARLVVPGLYGYVSATKWVTELEVTRFDRATAYWTRRGWSAEGPIKTEARIDTPRARARIAAGPTSIAGIAWAQHRGIKSVEVQIDNGDWQPARLSTEQSIDTWRQWVYDWNATPGPHTIRARATDNTGETQTSDRRDVVPDGATGYPSATVQVS